MGLGIALAVIYVQRKDYREDLKHYRDTIEGQWQMIDKLAKPIGRVVELLRIKMDTTGQFDAKSISRD